MNINPEEYTGLTSKLPIGASIKAVHNGCSSSAAMKITNDVEGLKFFCFKCREYCFESSFNSPRERLRRQEAFEAYEQAKACNSNELPSDCSQLIPEAGLSWLGSGGWTEQYIRHYEIQWSDKLQRVIIPIVSNGVYRGYTARACESWHKPKYLEKTDEGAYWQSDANLAGVDKLSTVLTEDVLSAGRTGKFYPSYSLLGTSLGTPLLNTLAEYNRVYLWLDPDKGGVQGAKSMINRLRLFTEVVMLKSRDDPKRLHDSEIRRLLVRS
jgi:hypothetical protein